MSRSYNDAMPKAYRRAESSVGIWLVSGIELFTDRGEEDIPDSKLPAVAALVDSADGRANLQI